VSHSEKRIPLPVEKRGNAKELSPEVARLKGIVADLKKSGKVKSQQVFAKMIGFDGPYLSAILGGSRGELTDKLLDNAQRVFHVSKPYIKLGVGEPFIKQEEDEAIVLLRQIAVDVAAIRSHFEETTKPIPT